MLPHPRSRSTRSASGPARAALTLRSSLVVTVLAVGGLSACSSDDDTDAAPSGNTTPVEAAGTTAPPTTAGAESDSDTVAPSSPATDEADQTDGTDEIDDSEAIEATRTIFAAVGQDDPGCTVAVGRDGEVVYAEAFGAARLDPTEPMTTETIVDIGSTSKQFTATAILLLAEDGLLDLDDPVAEYLTGLPEWADEVTLRQLVHHTSGIPDYIELLVDEGFDLTGSSTDADALAALAVSELDFEPATSWSYSNSNYFLMGQVVLAVTGVPLDEFLDTEVFQPLELAMVMDPVAALPGKAVSYEGTGDDRAVADSRWEQLGDGGIQTTPSELVRWSSQYWQPTIGGDGMLAARVDDAADIVDPFDASDEVGGRYGAGIEISEDPEIGTVLSHSGGWGGFVTVFMVVPDQRLTVTGTCTSPDTLEATGLTSEDELLEPWLDPA